MRAESFRQITRELTFESDPAAPEPGFPPAHSWRSQCGVSAARQNPTFFHPGSDSLIFFFFFFLFCERGAGGQPSPRSARGALGMRSSTTVTIFTPAKIPCSRGRGRDWSIDIEGWQGLHDVRHCCWVSYDRRLKAHQAHHNDDGNDGAPLGHDARRSLDRSACRPGASKSCCSRSRRRQAQTIAGAGTGRPDRLPSSIPARSQLGELRGRTDRQLGHQVNAPQDKEVVLRGLLAMGRQGCRTLTAVAFAILGRSLGRLFWLDRMGVKPCLYASVWLLSAPSRKAIPTSPPLPLATTPLCSRA